MRGLKTCVVFEPRLDYDGTQLRPHFLREAFGLKGDAAAAFRGACQVQGPALVDLEDRQAGAVIRSRDMVHVIVECFTPDLPRMVCLQRLLSALAADRVRAGLDPVRAATVRRRGDDVFVAHGKLSVSIATLSPVSALLHFAVNVDNRDTPVETSGLGPLGIDPLDFARGLLDDLRGEVDGIVEALGKVAPAHGEPS
jgi:hypothetical protein